MTLKPEEKEQHIPKRPSLSLAREEILRKALIDLIDEVECACNWNNLANEKVGSSPWVSSSDAYHVVDAIKQAKEALK